MKKMPTESAKHVISTHRPFGDYSYGEYDQRDGEFARCEECNDAKGEGDVFWPCSPFIAAEALLNLAECFTREDGELFRCELWMPPEFGFDDLLRGLNDKEPTDG